MLADIGALVRAVPLIAEIVVVADFDLVVGRLANLLVESVETF